LIYISSIHKAEVSVKCKAENKIFIMYLLLLISSFAKKGLFPLVAIFYH